MELVPEIWAPIEGWPYEVSSLGAVRRSSCGPRTSPGRAKALPLSRGGYPQVSLYRDGKARTFFVHTLVLETFVSSRPTGLQACHADGDKTNCSAGNLRWDTAKSNMEDRAAHGNTVMGERHWRSVFSTTEIEEIRRSHQSALAKRQAEGFKRVPNGFLRELANKYGANYGTLANLVGKQGEKNWKGVA